MVRLLLLGLGGALGTLARYAVGLWCQRRTGGAFPYGTLAVNVVGSFLLGVIMQLSATTDLLGTTARLTLGVGVMGGFTTYSTFDYETLKLLQDRARLTAGINLVATVAGCLVGGLLGIALASYVAAELGLGASKRLVGG
ncbi:fluoride efflux transporter CrcB [Sorangium sp. So ce134]